MIQSASIPFLDLVTFLAGGIFVTALFRLLALHVWPFIRDLPAWVHELAAHGTSAGVTFGGVLAGPEHGHWIGLVGCLLWAGAVAFSLARRRTRGGNGPLAMSAILTVLWSAATLWYGSSVLAYLAVGALMSALGFSVLVVPGCAFLGYSSRDRIPRTTSCAFLVLVGGLVLTLWSGVPAFLTPFADAAVRIGAFVYGVSLLILAARHYGHSSPARYRAMQVLTILSCLAGAWFGGAAGVEVLRRYSGTVLTLYLLEKYWEFPWREELQVWALLLFSFVLYGAALVARSYPQYFIL